MTGPQFFMSSDSGRWIDQTIQLLRAETRDDTLRRETTTFDSLASPYQDSLVLFGASYLGRYVLRGLREVGIRPIAFADNNAKLWGTEFEGLTVLSPADAIAQYNESACFVVTIYQGSRVTEQLESLGCKRIAPVAPLFWKFSDVFIPGSCLALPHQILENEDEVRAGYAVLSDDHSRREFCEQLLWRFKPETGILSPGLPERETYFPEDLVQPLQSEVFVDCGAFNGDSVRSFLKHRNNQFGKVYAIEPDPGNRADLCTWAASLDPSVGSRITALPYGVSDQDATLYFKVTNTAGSTLLTEQTESSIECRKLDTLFSNETPTYIKMDIEGAEPQAISGGELLLGTKHPVLAICVYHRCEHMWQIPSLIHSKYAGYSIFLRRYAEDCWEVVCYAVPPDRLVSA